jgi:polyhydroxybutyrate depolymerase
MINRISVFALAALLLAFPSPAAAQRGEARTWIVDGVARRAVIYGPAVNPPGGGSPVVLSFHGHGDNIENFQHTDLHRAWPDAVVVYVQGLPSRRDGLDGWQVEKGEDADRDLRLVDALLVSLHQSFKVDDQRIFATGFSNGANFTYLLWAERPRVFAAFAPVAARLRPSVKPVEPRPLFHVAGSRDQQIPFAGQLEAIEVARHVNGVTGKGASCGGECTIYGSDSAHHVMTWIHAGGHEYPLTTSERIARFFREHPGGPRQP